jgi:hypothetical protein
MTSSDFLFCPQEELLARLLALNPARAGGK